MKIAITQTVIEKTKPKEKPYEIRDKRLVGFLIRVQPTGKMTYYCEYRRGGRVKIGPESAFSVKSARILAKQILADYYQGGEPAIAAKKAKTIATYRDYLEEHYFQWVDANHSAAKATKRCLLVDCAPFLKKRLVDITPQSVEKWRTGRVASGLSPYTANRSYATLRASLTKAEEWGFIAEHPLRKMKPIKTDSNLKIRFLSVNEEVSLRTALDARENRIRNERINGNFWRLSRNQKLMTDLSKLVYADHLKPMVILSINTGIRRGELFSLCWKHVDFDLKQITIEGTNAKSRKVRHIPLNSEALETLVNWRAQNPTESVHVFTNQFGHKFQDIKTAWKRLLITADIQDFRWHDLRHHFASRLTMNGVSLNTIRELLGHSSYTMTLRYAHISASHKENAVSKLIEKMNRKDVFIRDHLSTAIQSNIDEVVKEHFRRVTQEPQLTSRVAQKLEDSLNGLSIQGLTASVIAQEMPDRGPKSLESINGIDLYIGLRVINVEGQEVIKKGIIVQAKNYSNSRADKQLLDQCRKMTMRSKVGSYVWVYGPFGVSTIPAEEVLRNVKTRISEFSSRNLAEHFRDVFDCVAGDRKLAWDETFDNIKYLKEYLDAPVMSAVTIDLKSKL